MSNEYHRQSSAINACDQETGEEGSQVQASELVNNYVFFVNTFIEALGYLGKRAPATIGAGNAFGQFNFEQR